MKKHILAIICVVSVIGLAFNLNSCSSTPSTNTSNTLASISTESTIIVISFTSQVLAQTEDPERDIVVRLPLDYEQNPRARYPVLYTLHGFGAAPNEVLSALQAPLDQAVLAGQSRDYIVVGIDGRNDLSGSFYVNSSATGNWEDQITQEIIPLIDSTYRTIPDAQHRALSGMSMGGFAAWNLLLSRPDLFSVAWACAPGAFDERGLEDALLSWDQHFLAAYGAAFAPDMNLEYPHAQIISADEPANSAQEKAVWQLWRSGFGNAEAHLKKYFSQNARIKALHFAYGKNDYYKWIPRGAVYLEQKFRQAGLPTSISSWNAAHNLTAEMAAKGLVPFIAEAFR